MRPGTTRSPRRRQRSLGIDRREGGSTHCLERDGALRSDGPASTLAGEREASLNACLKSAASTLSGPPARGRSPELDRRSRSSRSSAALPPRRVSGSTRGAPRRLHGLRAARRRWNTSTPSNASAAAKIGAENEREQQQEHERKQERQISKTAGRFGEAPRDRLVLGARPSGSTASAAPSVVDARRSHLGAALSRPCSRARGAALVGDRRRTGATAAGGRADAAVAAACWTSSAAGTKLCLSS